jgi:hypothetical protein
MFSPQLSSERFSGCRDGLRRSLVSARRLGGVRPDWGLLLLALIGSTLLAADNLAWAVATTGEPVSELVPGPEQSVNANQIVLFNARHLGSRCNATLMADRLRCERLSPCGRGRGCWQSVDWEEVLADFWAYPMPTVIYIHGNRIARGEDRARGMMVYHSLIRGGSQLGGQREAQPEPIRYLIWSWPSTRILGPLHDYRVKAARTRTAGWHLAWLVDRLPPDTPLSMIGYSYGARVASGALHLLGGGELSGLKLAQRVHPQERAVRAAFIAAALDATWMHPDGYHGKALSQIERLMLVNNRRDPAMRLFHLSIRHGRPLALGLRGFTRNTELREVAMRIQSFDVTAQVGRTHALNGYLMSSQSLEKIWDTVCFASRAGRLEQRSEGGFRSVLTASEHEIIKAGRQFMGQPRSEESRQAATANRANGSGA